MSGQDWIPAVGDDMPPSGVRGFSPTALEAAMRRKGAASDDLADGIGVSRQSVSAWLSGKTVPTPVMIGKAATWLNVRTADLIPIPPDKLRLADLRTRAGLNQRNAAELIGVSASVLYEAEKGRREKSDDWLAVMSEAYGVAIEDVANAWDRTRAARAARIEGL
ncbi:MULTISPECIES: helix-turn-helix transcriptional regulator [unclassified Rhodococcus (in: high G+C Gram-positive bacteria)]|uniref:helix-turn-helix transcriptional regulator n=1 Tax=unclassified Rhodococcus (in: high G+C Gram-positive bacteria) TaxID=192944 RepID=UPI000A031F9B|nr:helix-turn-helix transcriptional regulator [Rhodococcus sp. DK17]